MAVVELETLVAAPPERCFDLSLSIDLHVDSAAATRERAVAGTTTGVIGLRQSVTWEARHLGRRRRLTVTVTRMNRPAYFRDEQVDGPFRRMTHDHWFERAGDRTRMRDRFEFSTSVPLFDRLVLVRHFRRFLSERNAAIKAAAESDGWRRYLD